MVKGEEMLCRSVLLAFLAFALLPRVCQANGGGSAVGECTSCYQVANVHRSCCDRGPVCDACCQCESRWTTTAEWLWMGRNRADQQSLLIADVNAVQIPVLDVSDLSFDINGGVRTRISRRFESGRRLELNYLGLIDQTARQSIFVDPAIPLLNSVTHRFFGDAGGNSLSYQADYQSDLHSGEMNLQFGCYYGLEPLVGIRWLYLGERIDLFEIPTPTSGALGELRNNMIGAQVGFNKVLWGHDRWLRAELTMKGGLFHNSIDMHGDVHTAAGPTMAIDRQFTETSALGEIHLTAIWEVTPFLRFRAGYSGLWLNDVSFVADQLDNFNIATGQGNLESAHARFHGGHVGFEVDW